MKQLYSICGKTISIESPLPLTEHENFSIFAVDEGASDIKITYHVAENLPATPVNTKTTPVGALVSWEGDRIFRHAPMGTAEGALSCYKATDTSQSDVYFTNQSYGVMSDFRYMWHSVSLGQLFLPFKILLFHASYISTKAGAILFTAPCGTGKSTQAGLWQQFMGAEVINGDKAGVSVDESGAYAHGLPFCGTSGICKNKSMPLKAIVVLGQAPENKITPITGVSAIQSLLSNLYLDFVAPGETQQCVDVIIDLLSKVPVYSLQCTPDEDAVKCLAKELGFDYE